MSAHHHDHHFRTAQCDMHMRGLAYFLERILEMATTQELVDLVNAQKDEIGLLKTFVGTLNTTVSTQSQEIADLEAKLAAGGIPAADQANIDAAAAGVAANTGEITGLLPPAPPPAPAP
jgi:hypothetical protein